MSSHREVTIKQNYFNSGMIKKGKVIWLQLFPMDSFLYATSEKCAFSHTISFTLNYRLFAQEGVFIGS